MNEPTLKVTLNSDDINQIDRLKAIIMKRAIDNGLPSKMPSSANVIRAALTAYEGKLSSAHK